MYKITKAQIKQIRSLQQKKYRDELGWFVAEGDKCIGELEGYFECVLKVSKDNATDSEIAQMSSLKTPQGSIAVFKQRGGRLAVGGERLTVSGERLTVRGTGSGKYGNYNAHSRLVWHTRYLLLKNNG